MPTLRIIQPQESVELAFQLGPPVDWEDDWSRWTPLEPEQRASVRRERLGRASRVALVGGERLGGSGAQVDPVLSDARL